MAQTDIGCLGFILRSRCYSLPTGSFFSSGVIPEHWPRRVSYRLAVASLSWWFAPHPAWEPGDDWPRDVPVVRYETDAEVALIDPLLPPDDSFHPHDKPVRVLLTYVAESRRTRHAERIRIDALGAQALKLLPPHPHLFRQVVAGRLGHDRQAIWSVEDDDAA